MSRQKGRPPQITGLQETGDNWRFVIYQRLNQLFDKGLFSTKRQTSLINLAVHCSLCYQGLWVINQSMLISMGLVLCPCLSWICLSSFSWRCDFFGNVCRKKYIEWRLGGTVRPKQTKKKLALICHQGKKGMNVILTSNIPQTKMLS